MTTQLPIRPSPSKRDLRRWALLFVSLGIVGITLPYFDLLDRMIEREGSKEVIRAAKPTEELRKAIDYRVDLSKSLFQATLIVLGAIWSILLAKKDESSVVFHDWLAVTVFGCANIVLFAAGYEHIQYVWEMSDLLAQAALIDRLPDVGSWFVSASLLSQFIRVFCALLVTAFAFLCAKWG